MYAIRKINSLSARAILLSFEFVLTIELHARKENYVISIGTGTLKKKDTSLDVVGHAIFIFHIFRTSNIHI